MDEFDEVEISFVSSLERARRLVDIRIYLGRNVPALDMDDMLRSSVVLTVSAFDYLVHQVFLIEVLRRLKSQREILRFEIPFSLLHAIEEERADKVEAYVVSRNAHRTFVDPGKLSEAISCFVENPWSKIAAELGCDANDLKASLRRLYRWRNRIAHEADINPTYSGVTLWPIEESDVRAAVSDTENLGKALLAVMRAS